MRASTVHKAVLAAAARIVMNLVELPYRLTLTGEPVMETLVVVRSGILMIHKELAVVAAPAAVALVPVARGCRSPM